MSEHTQKLEAELMERMVRCSFAKYDVYVAEKFCSDFCKEVDCEQRKGSEK